MDSQDQINEKALLVLDLDETLIHSSHTELGRTPDINVFEYYVFKRPFLKEFLKEVDSFYKIAIWSTGSDDYVDILAKAILPEGMQFEFVWGRSHCSIRNIIMNMGGESYNTRLTDFVKPLKKLKNKGYRIERILIVDDSPSKCVNNYGNAIFIDSFLGEPDDQELSRLVIYLKSIATEPNYRAIEKRGWRDKVLNKDFTH